MMITILNKFKKDNKTRLPWMVEYETGEYVSGSAIMDRIEERRGRAGGRRFRLVKGSRELEKAWGCRWQPELVAMPVGLRGPQHYVRPRCPSQFNFLMEIP